MLVLVGAVAQWVCVCVCVAVGCLTGVGQSDVGQPMPPVPAALLLPLPRLPRRALLLRPAARCAHSLRLLLLEVDGLGVGVPLELVLLAVLWE